MKSNITVLFPDVSNPATGKGFFLQGLVPELEKIAVNVIFDKAQDHDIVFENIRIKNKTTKPIVIRFDGVYHDSAIDYESKNSSMREAAKKASQIICQSDFGKSMVMNYLDADSKKISIIHNGSNPNAEWSMPELKHKHNFIAVAVWRPHKRLRETILSFLIADIPDSVLRVFGKFGSGMDDSIKKYAGDKVIFMDQVSDRSVLIGHMRAATAMIHLCWFDCCPNSVVEAINQQCPVVCSNQGGTHELVSPSGGYVLDLDDEYFYAPVDLYNPPKININYVARVLDQIAQKRPNINNSLLHISIAAKKYKTVFEKALS